jgi:chemotaxis protein MotB
MSRRPIFLIKKKVAHAGHHGGAWKVAYADFVTAMMSLFIVLWLLSSNAGVKKAVAGYFRDPSGTAAQTGSDRTGAGDNLPLKQEDIQNLKAKIEQAIKAQAAMQSLKDQVQMTITPEGLRIELLESKNGTFFDSGRSQLSATGDQMLELLARQLGQVPNRISIEGHTDAQPYAGTAGYSNWELSTDRANSARRLMEADGLRTGQVAQVRGYADQQLRLPKSPLDPSNRRISIIVQYAAGSPAGFPAAVTGPSASSPAAGSAKPSAANKPSPAAKPAAAHK